MASKRAVSQLSSLAQRRPEVCLRMRSQWAVSGCCRCKSTVRYVKRDKRERQGPNIKKKMPMAEKIMRKTQYNLENSVTPMLNEEELKHVFSSDLFVFRCDITTGSQVESAMGLYNKTLAEIGILTPNDMSNLARAVHFTYRASKSKDGVLRHIRTLMKDLRSGKVPGHPLAWVHIISCLKEMQEYEEVNVLWEWLQGQNEDHLDSRVVGAMIEALALQGEGLPKLEHMFRQALQDYSVHMDEGGSLNHRATRIMLLQGIITARLLSGEWRRAYDGLDICLQLHPTWTPSRVFELFIFQRPVLEGYVVFLMACRAGKALAQRVVTHLMKAWIDETKDVTALMRMLYSYVGAGGKPTYEHMNIIVSALLKFVPNYRLLKDKTAEEMKAINEHSQEVLSFVKAFIAAFQEAGVQPARATYNTILGEGGKLGNMPLVTATLETMVNAQLPPDLITYRILLGTFGMLKQKSQVRASWESLRKMRMQIIKEQEAEKKSKVPQFDPAEKKVHATIPRWELRDWKALAKGCVYADMMEYLDGQLAQYGHEIPFFMREMVLKYAENVAKGIEDPEEQPESFQLRAPSPDSMLALHQSLGRAKVDFGKFRAIIKSASAHDFTTTPISFEELPGLEAEAFTLMMPDEELQTVYKKFTESRKSPFLSNWYKPGADYQDPKAFVSTGGTVGQLRFENWMSINKLLFLAELSEVEKINSMLGNSKPEEPARRINQTPAKRCFGSEYYTQIMRTRKKTINKMFAEIQEKMKTDTDAWDEIGVFRSALVGGSMEDPLKSLEGQDYLKLQRENTGKEV